MTKSQIHQTRQAFHAMVQHHQGIVLKIAYAYCRSATDREELAQEITAQLWSAYPRYDSSRPFSTWMYRIALNVAIVQVRRAGHPSRTATALDRTHADRIAAPEPLEQDPRIPELKRILDSMQPLNRALLVLYLDDRSHREIADILGITETNVATKINRLKQGIRQELDARST
jgi:RNA polymerase sigma-70 factor (ECF subfamily)